MYFRTIVCAVALIGCTTASVALDTSVPGITFESEFLRADKTLRLIIAIDLPTTGEFKALMYSCELLDESGKQMSETLGSISRTRFNARGARMIWTVENIPHFEFGLTDIRCKPLRVAN